MVTNRQRYREKVSQMVSWGHWFALFNILLATLIGCRYLFVADWPTTLTGRIYSWTDKRRQQNVEQGKPVPPADHLGDFFTVALTIRHHKLLFVSLNGPGRR